MSRHDLRGDNRLGAPDALLARGLESHRVGRFKAAAEIYLEFLAIRPKHPVALHLLGEASCHLGDPTTGVSLMRQAVALKPDYAEAHNNLGVRLLALGRVDEAATSFRAAVRCKGHLAAPLINLANLLAEHGAPLEAVGFARRAAQRDPASVDAQRALAGSLRVAGKFEESHAVYQRLVGRLPDEADLRAALGFVQAALGLADEARESYRRTLTLAPEHPHALNNLGNLERAAGRTVDAEALYRRALIAAPDFAEAMHNLGGALCALDRAEDGLALLRAAVARRPDFAEAWNALGNASRQVGDDSGGEAAYREAAHVQPGHPGALNNLGLLHWQHGDGPAAIASFRAALESCPGFAEAHSNLLFALHGDPEASPLAILEASREFEQRQAPTLTSLAHPRPVDGDPNRRLRVGYVSPDLREHSCAYFLEPLLEAHRREEVEVFAYSGVPRPDAVTARLRAKCDHWRSTLGWSDQALVEQVRADRIDVLVDLAGHSANNRLTAFLAHPAPVQVTWLGYPGTTGLSAIGYRLTDALCDPPGVTEGFHSEALVRLDRGAHCYHPPEAAPAVAPLPSARRGHVTFGSFNQLAKTNTAVIAAWARILSLVPGARLCLKATALAQPSVRARVLGAFAVHGVDPVRLDLLAWCANPADHLARYADIDVALDPFPYNGTTTTCEALWMGVPVLALAGDRHAARVGLHLLTRVGHPELVTESVDGYVALAVALAADPARLGGLRASLREDVRASPLCDAAGFARSVEAAYRAMWRASNRA